MFVGNVSNNVKVGDKVIIVTDAGIYTSIVTGVRSNGETKEAQRIYTNDGLCCWYHDSSTEVLVEYSESKFNEMLIKYKDLIVKNIKNCSNDTVLNCIWKLLNFKDSKLNFVEDLTNELT